MNDFDSLLESIQNKLESTYIDGLPYNLMNYIHGRCHIFAQALHEELGYELEFLWDNDFWFEDNDFPSTVLVHAYCIKNNHSYVDARGFVSKELIEYEFECNELSYEKFSYEDLQNAYKDNILEKPTEEELNLVKDYIRKNFIDYQ